MFCKYLYSNYHFIILIIFYSSQYVFSLTGTGACRDSSNQRNCGVGHHCLQTTRFSWACLCQPGYAPTGRQDNICQKINICSVKNLCFNMGVCQADATDSMKYTCTCKPGFVGSNCEQSQTICDTSTPCQNDGVCAVSSTSPPGFVCICARGFKGDTCNIPISVGIGGTGTVLSGGNLVFIWTLWIILMTTFLYCGFQITSTCWAKRAQKIATTAVAAAL